MAAQAPSSLSLNGTEKFTDSAEKETQLRQPISPSAFLEPLQELCPSLDAVQSLCLASVEQLPGGESFRQSRLRKITLKAASSGDVELLSWICHAQSQRNESYVRAESAAFRGFSWTGIRDEEGTGPVNLAASSGHEETVRLLIRNGAEVDERDGSGWTPLMWATNNGNLPLVSFLLSQGANSHAKTFKGVTCEDFIISSAPLESPLSTSLETKTKVSIFEKHESMQKTKSAATDRQLIGDLIFEHQKAQEQSMEGEERSLQSRLRNLSISSSGSATSGFEAGSSPRIATSHTITASSSTTKSFGGHSRSSSATMRRLVGRTERTQMVEAELRSRELAEGRRRALLEVAVMLQVDYEDLLGQVPVASATPLHRRRQNKRKTVHSGLSSGCGAIEVGSDPLSVEFDFDIVRPDQMLVFGESNIESIINHMIPNAKPVRAPWSSRSKPANVMFMCARFAASFEDANLLEELMFSFISAVEASLYAHPTELTYLAFWLYNGVLLLHYFKRDKTLAKLDGVEELESLLSELVNEVYIFIVRDVERRIDKILQVAVLDHESIPSFEEVRYEDEWSFIKTIRGSVKGLGGVSGGAGGSGSSSPAASASLRRPLSQMFVASDTNIPSPRNSVHSSPSTNNRRTSKGAPPIPSSFFPSSPPSILRSPPKQRLDQPAQEASTVADLLARPSPRTITSLLTSVLHVLQLYEINPCIIVQALSQIFFWVGCELFNRIVMHKRYICKNKAMQIRLNVSTLEDWVKTNALPSTLISIHFARVNQLVSWCLCQSSLGDFDALISTLQGLRSLAPVQLKHVVDEYRYEQGESRMDGECAQYLDQLQIDWTRRQADLRAMALAARHNHRAESGNLDPPHGHSRTGTATQDNPQGLRGSNDSEEELETDEVEQLSATSKPKSLEDLAMDKVSSPKEDIADLGDAAQSADHQFSAIEKLAFAARKDIDMLFAPGRSMNDFVPRLPSDGEDARLSPTNAHDDVHTPRTGFGVKGAKANVLLNSRDMLPFALPSQASAIIVSPGDAFGFGRGHFMGTGTPSLKSMRTESLVPSPSPSLHGGGPSTLRSRSGLGIRHGTSNSADTSRSPSPFKPAAVAVSNSTSQGSGSLLAAPRSTLQAGLGIHGVTSLDDVVDAPGHATSSGAVNDGSEEGAFDIPDSLSQHSSNLSGLSGQSTSSVALFPQGKGLAAGASWQPVPVLPDGTLEALTVVMRSS